MAKSYLVFAGILLDLVCVVSSLSSLTDRRWQVCFIGYGGWEDVTNVQISHVPAQTDLENIDFKSSQDFFGYVISAAAGDSILLRLQKGGATFHVDFDVHSRKGTLPEGVVVNLKALNNTGIAAPKLAALTTKVRHHGMWLEFAKRMYAEATNTSADVASLMKGAWEYVRRSHMGFEINIFIDGFQHAKGSKMVLQYTWKGGNIKTEKTVQESGAVFSAWSIPKKDGTFKYWVTGGGFKAKEFKVHHKNIHSRTIKLNNGKEANAHIMIFTNHRKMEQVWRTVQSALDTNAIDTYWDKKLQKWNEYEFHKLYEQVRDDKKLRPDSLESGGDVEATDRWKIFVIVAVVVAIAIAILYWFLCKQGLDFDESTNTGKEIEAKATQTNNEAIGSDQAIKTEVATVETSVRGAATGGQAKPQTNNQAIASEGSARGGGSSDKHADVTTVATGDQAVAASSAAPDFVML